jgi:dihydroorotase
MLENEYENTDGIRRIGQKTRIVIIVTADPKVIPHIATAAQINSDLPLLFFLSAFGKNFYVFPKNKTKLHFMKMWMKIMNKMV